MADHPWDWTPLPPPHHLAYSRNGIWAGKDIADLAIESALRDPEFVAFIDGDTATTRSVLLSQAEALSAAMGDLGLKAGDVISFQTPNWVEAAVINIAAAMSSLVVNPIVPIYRDAEVRAMLSDCGAKAFFVASHFRGFDFMAMAARIQPLLPNLDHIIEVRGQGPLTFAALVESGRGRAFNRPQNDPNGIKMVLYTSGTTGKAKGVLHSHNSRLRITQQAIRHWQISPGEAQIIPAPVTHIAGYANGLELPFIGGTRSVLMESWNAKSAVSLIEKHAVTGTIAATPFLVGSPGTELEFAL